MSDFHKNVKIVRPDRHIDEYLKNVNTKKCILSKNTTKIEMKKRKLKGIKNLKTRLDIMPYFLYIFVWYYGIIFFNSHYILKIKNM